MLGFRSFLLFVFAGLLLCSPALACEHGPAASPHHAHAGHLAHAQAMEIAHTAHTAPAALKAQTQPSFVPKAQTQPTHALKAQAHSSAALAAQTQPCAVSGHEESHDHEHSAGHSCSHACCMALSDLPVLRLSQAPAHTQPKAPPRAEGSVLWPPELRPPIA